MKGLRLIGVAVGFVVIADQITKAIVAARLSPFESVTVVPGFFNLVYWHNSGAAFGMLSDSGSLATILLTALTCIALIVIGFLLRTAIKEDDRIATLALSLIGGGAIGNLIDRIRLGEVIDFLDFYLGSKHWPAFNIADSAITVGVVLMLASFFIKPPKRKTSDI